MKKTFKVLSFIFAIVLLVSLGCVAVFADNTSAAPEVWELSNANGIVGTYATLQEAIDNSYTSTGPNADESVPHTITLLADTTGKGAMIAGKEYGYGCADDLTIDLNGFTFTVNEGYRKSDAKPIDDKGIRVAYLNSFVMKNGTVNVAADAHADLLALFDAIQGNGYVELNDVVLDGTNLPAGNTSDHFVVRVGSGAVVLTGDNSGIKAADGNTAVYVSQLYGASTDSDPVEILVDDAADIIGTIHVANSNIANAEIKLITKTGVIPAEQFAYASDDAKDSITAAPIAATIGDNYYLTLADAIAAAQDGDVIKLADGTHTMPKNVSNKNITITGTKKAIIEYGFAAVNQDAITAHDSTIVFDGITVKTDNGNYEGFQHAEKIVYNNCDHYGQEFLYAPTVEYTGCTFYITGDAYAVWTYGASDVTFTDCDFYTDGKAILTYTESAHEAVVKLINCNFYSTGVVTGKAAVEVGQSASGNKAQYAIFFEDCTADANFSGKNTDAALYGDKNNMAAVSGMGVFVDNAHVYGTAVKNTTTGEVYISLADAVAAAQDGDTVILLADSEGNGIVINKSITIDLNGFAYSCTSTGWTTALYIEPGFRGPSHPDYDSTIGKGEGYYTYPSVTIMNGKISTTGTAPAIQSFGNLTLKDVEITSTKNGVAIQAGNNQILGNTSITAPGVYALLFQATSNDYNEGTQLTIDTTGSITGVIQFQLQGGGTTDENNALVINNVYHDGKFDGTASADWAEADFFGGSYNDLAAVNYLADGKTYVVSNGRYTVIDESEVLTEAVAKLNDVYYTTLAEAVLDAQDGNTVKLLKDFTGEGFTYSTDITIDLGGYTFCNTSPIYSKGHNTSIWNGTIAPVDGNNKAIVREGDNYQGHLDLFDVTLVGDYISGDAYLLTIQGAGEVVLTEGTSIYAHRSVTPVDGKNAIYIDLPDGQLPDNYVYIWFYDVWALSGAINFQPAGEAQIGLDIGEINVWNANLVYADGLYDECITYVVRGKNAAMTVGTLHLMPGDTLLYIDDNNVGSWITTPDETQGNHDDLAIGYYPEYDRFAVGVISYTTLDAEKVYGTNKWYDPATFAALPGTGSYEFNAYKNAFGFTVAGDNHHDHFVPTPATRTVDFDGSSLLYENVTPDGKHYLNFRITHVSATSVYSIDQECFIIDDDGATLTWTDENGNKITKTFTGAGDIIIVQSKIINNYGPNNAFDFDYDSEEHAGDYPVVGDFEFTPISRPAFDGPIAVKYSVIEPENRADHTQYGLTVAPTVINFADDLLVNGTLTVYYIAYDTGYYCNYAPAYGSYTLTINKISLAGAEFELQGHLGLVYNALEREVTIADDFVLVTKDGKEFVLVEGEDYEISGNKATNAGTYTFTITALDDSNYKDEATRDWTIAQRELMLQPVYNTVVYGHAYQQLPATSTNPYPWYAMHMYDDMDGIDDNWWSSISSEIPALYALFTTSTDYVVGDSVGTKRTISVIYAEGKSAADHPNYKIDLSLIASLEILPETDVGADFEAKFDKLIFNGENQTPVLNSLIVTKYDFNTTDNIKGEVIDPKNVQVAEGVEYHAGTYTIKLTILSGNYEGAVLEAHYTIHALPIKDVNWTIGTYIYKEGRVPQGPTAEAYGPQDTVLTLSTTKEVFVGEYWSYVEDIVEISNKEHLPSDYVLDLLSIHVAAYEIKEAIAVKFESAFVDIGDTYALNFIIPALALEQYDLTDADEDTLFDVFYNGSHRFASAGEFTFERDGDEYILDYNQIAPNNMAKDVTVTPKFGKNPKDISYSIAQYCYDMIKIYDKAAEVNANTNEHNLYYDFVKMIASLLNYGDSAESYMNAIDSTLLEDVVVKAGVKDFEAFVEKYDIDPAEKPGSNAAPVTPPTTSYKYSSDEMLALKPNLSFALGSAPAITLTYELPAGMTAADLQIGFMDRTEGGAATIVDAKDTGSVTFQIPLSAADHTFRIIVFKAGAPATWYMMVEVSNGHFSNGDSADMNNQMAAFATALADYLAWIN